VQHDHDLVDTREMYLRTVLELEEESVVPLRARIAERLGQSVVTVSETVSRLGRDGLLSISAEGDRRIELTPDGRSLAQRVMRKHRLAECLLVDLIGLDWALVHEEACRWEHVMSEEVERRLLDVLGHPTHSPYGNPIPGLGELGESSSGERAGPSLVPLTSVPSSAGEVVVRRIGEPLQSDQDLLSRLARAGVSPNHPVPFARVDGEVRIGAGEGAATLDDGVAAHVFVSAPS
jgi:DtxR family Mn-dependent transcriptional regulator